MALRFIDSFDHYDTAHILRKWTDGVLLTAIVINPTGGRCGTQALSVGSTFGVTVIKGVAFSTNTVVIGFALKMTDTPAFPTTTPFLFIGGPTENHLSLNWNPDGSLSVFRPDPLPVLLGTTAPGLIQNTVYEYVEIKAFIDNVGTVEIRLNGGLVPVLNVVGVDTRRGDATVTRFSFQPAANFRFLIDDLYALDNSGGAPNNDFLGDSRVEYLQPTAPGANQAWAVVGAPTHWQAVNDGASPDDDTTYITSTTPGATDTEEYSNTGLPAGGTIFGLQVGLYARKTDSGLREVAPIVRHAGVDFAGTSQSPGFPDYTYLLQLYETNPGTAAPWTIADVNNAEYGIRVTT